jgi:hypothetical protein
MPWITINGVGRRKVFDEADYLGTKRLVTSAQLHNRVAGSLQQYGYGLAPQSASPTVGQHRPSACLFSYFGHNCRKTATGQFQTTYARLLRADLLVNGADFDPLFVSQDGDIDGARQMVLIELQRGLASIIQWVFSRSGVNEMDSGIWVSGASLYGRVLVQATVNSTRRFVS